MMNDTFSKLMFNTLKNYMNLTMTFLPERIKLGKVENFVNNSHDKNEYLIHIRNLKEALSHELILIE